MLKILPGHCFSLCSPRRSGTATGPPKLQGCGHVDAISRLWVFKDVGLFCMTYFTDVCVFVLMQLLLLLLLQPSMTPTPNLPYANSQRKQVCFFLQVAEYSCMCAGRPSASQALCSCHFFLSLTTRRKQLVPLQRDCNHPLQRSVVQNSQPK